MEHKNKRGCNYTPQEKEILLDLITKYIDIIENKDTHALTVVKKRETWNNIAMEYNAVAVSGTRTWMQLRHLYENLKQRSKNKVAGVNRKKYFDNQKLCSLLNKKALDEEKKELTVTCEDPYNSSSGNYDNTLTDTMYDDEILTNIKVEYDVPSTSQINEHAKIKKTCKPQGTIQEQYFTIKLQNAKLEKKYLINRNRREHNKYKLEMEILLKKLSGRP